MKTEWKQFLQQRGGEWADPDAPLSHFGNPSQELSLTLSGEVLVDLGQRGLIAVSGSDAESFLQNMLSNDVRQVSESRSQLTSLNTPKGRMLALMRLFRREGVFYLDLPRALVENILKRLRMYVLRSQVSLESANDALVHFGVNGTHAAERLESLLGAVPASDSDVLHHKGVTLVRQSAAKPHQQRFALYGELEPMQKLWQALDVHATPVGGVAWDLLDTLCGLPEIYPATQEAFVPQMVNLECIGGVSFKKGCYPGQEVVARMHYLGKPARRMFLYHAPLAQHAAPGEKIINPADGQELGEVVRSAPHPDGGVVLLGVMRLNALTSSEQLQLGHDTAATLSPLPLPYTLEDESA